MSDQDNKNQKKKDRRGRDDRRSLSRSASFPYETKQGLLIYEDRRRIPERRINNISVEDTEINEEEFIKKYQ